jgi:hypothetical protein
MRSYYSHLQAVKNVGEEVLITQKPTYRSSAIFPVIHNADYSSKVIFMGYWLMKRHIKEIALLYTLRDNKGQLLARKNIVIDSTKAFSIQMNEFLNVIEGDFRGSLELEIFSTQDLVFPYPAFVLVYYNDHFSTAVHTVGRIYNDIEDLTKNEEYRVREAGFDIYGAEHLSPFIAFTNGPLKNKNAYITYEINATGGKSEKGKFEIGVIEPFATVFLELKKHINLPAILGKEAGSIKVGHNLEGFFPRFAVGNFDTRSKVISITHSYYDCSELADEKSFWNRKDDLFNDSSVAIPLYITDDFYTRIAIYPIFSPSNFTLSYDFYTEDGKLLTSLKNYHTIKSSDNKYEQIDFKSILQDEKIDLATAKTVNMICNWDDKSKIPTRIKFGLNVGKENHLLDLPSNICFAPQLGNPAMLKKQGTFRWAPFVNVGDSDVVFTNSASLKEYTKPANLKLTFHRIIDDTQISRTVAIAANGSSKISIKDDTELNKFFDGESGWVTAQCDNPFVGGYYFDIFENGAVGADHVF